MAHECAAALEAALSPDKSTREKALEWLERFREADLGGFLVALSNELRNTERSALCRQQAGLQLKNAVYSKDVSIADQKGQKWLALDAALRDMVKQSALATLGTETYSPSSAPQVVSSIALIEIPASQWPALMGQLCEALKNPSAQESHRIAFLETIGYICEELAPNLLEAEANNILTVIVQGMRSTEPNTRVKLAAATALLNSLDFCRANFERETERHFIMQVTCELTQCPDLTVAARALECLVRIVALYYSFMDTYMGALIGIAVQAMKSSTETVANQGIEFWSTLAEEEMEIEYEDESNAHDNNPQPTRHKHFCRQGLGTAGPVLLELLTKAEDDDDDADEWNTSKAASVCLNLLGRVVRDEMLPLVVPFVSANVSNPKWQFRDAAILAFGAVVDGPSHTAISQLVTQAFPHLLGMMKDPVAAVKDSVAWLLSKIIEVLPQLVLISPNFGPLLFALVSGLQMEPRVATNCCWAIYFIAIKLQEMHFDQEEDEPQTWLLSEHFDQLVTVIFTTVERPDAAQQGLRLAGYEALMQLFRNSPPDCYNVVKTTTIRVLQSLQASLAVQARDSELLRQVGEAQALLCGLLGVLVRKLQAADVLSSADAIAQVLVSVLGMAQASGCKDVLEDCFGTVSSLSDVLGVGMLKYMDTFSPLVVAALGDYQDYHVCQAAVGVVSDVVRGLGEQAVPYINAYMTALLNALSEPSLNRVVKPHIVSCFGDIATALGLNFKPYLQVTLGLLGQASQVAQLPVDAEDYDAVDAANDLRTSILQAYTSCLTPLTNAPADLQLLLPQVPLIFTFMSQLVQLPELNEECLQAALGLFGDLCVAYGKQLLPLIPGPLTSRLFQQQAKAQPKTRELVKYATIKFQTIHS